MIFGLKLLFKLLKYLCVLLKVWKLGWSPQPGGEYGTTLPEIPVDFLQEKDVFREFLYRINTLGVQTHMCGKVHECNFSG